MGPSGAFAWRCRNPDRGGRIAIPDRQIARDRVSRLVSRARHHSARARRKRWPAGFRRNVAVPRSTRRTGARSPRRKSRACRRHTPRPSMRAVQVKLGIWRGANTAISDRRRQHVQSSSSPMRRVAWRLFGRRGILAAAGPGRSPNASASPGSTLKPSSTVWRSTIDRPSATLIDDSRRRSATTIRRTSIAPSHARFRSRKRCRCRYWPAVHCSIASGRFGSRRRASANAGADLTFPTKAPFDIAAWRSSASSFRATI